MLRVPDVRAVMAWYEAIGFRVVETGEATQEDGAIGWCSLCFEGATLMLRPGNESEGAGHGDVALCFDVSDVDGAFARVAPHAEVVCPPRDPPYGQRDFEVRDPGGLPAAVREWVPL